MSLPAIEVLNRPAVQSSSLLLTTGPSLANDGDPTTASVTSVGLNPYWQMDLLGYYLIATISVTIGKGDVTNGFVGVSQYDSQCAAETTTTLCGSFPSTYKEQIITFKCSSRQPIRYIRVWREGKYDLTIYEVEATGQPSVPTGALMTKVEVKQTLSNTPSETQKSSESLKSGTSLSKVAVAGVIPPPVLYVAMGTVCMSRCLQQQPCVGVSFSSSYDDCIIATDTSMEIPSGWEGWHIRSCPLESMTTKGGGETKGEAIDSESYSESAPSKSG